MRDISVIILSIILAPCSTTEQHVPKFIGLCTAHMSHLGTWKPCPQVTADASDLRTAACRVGSTVGVGWGGGERDRFHYLETLVLALRSSFVRIPSFNTVYPVPGSWVPMC